MNDLGKVELRDPIFKKKYILKTEMLQMNFGESGRFHVIADNDEECKVPLKSEVNRRREEVPLRKTSFKIEEELMRYRRVLGGNRISLPGDGLQRSCAHKASKSDLDILC